MTVLVVPIPRATAVYAGRRAIKAGDRSGAYPAVIAAVVGAAVIVLTVVSEVGNLMRE